MLSTYQKLKQSFRKDWYKLPNILTLSRLIGSFIPGAMLIFGPNNYNFRMIIVFVFIALASTDMFDGLSARILKQETEFGRLLDPIADLFFGLLILVALSTIYHFIWPLTMLLVIRQIHILYLFYWADKKGIPVTIVISGKAKTAAVIVATVALLLPVGILSQQTLTLVIITAYIFTTISWIDYLKKYADI